MSLSGISSVDDFSVLFYVAVAVTTLLLPTNAAVVIRFNFALS